MFIFNFSFLNTNILFQELEQLRQEKLEIDQQLRSIHGSAIGSMPSLPMSRRNDRGYNSDMDGNTGGRIRGGGSMRSRGGRGRGGPSRQNDSRYNSGSNTINDYVNNIDKSRKSMVSGNGRGRVSATNGRSTRGGSGGDRSNRDRPNRGRSSVETVAGGDRERK